MKIIRGAEPAEIKWTARKLVEMIEDGSVNFNIDIQRGYVWRSNEKKSMFIHTLIMNESVPPLYFNKVEDVYEGTDGKQRSYTLVKFLNDEFALSDLPLFNIINDDCEVEEFDINGLKYSELPEAFQNAVKEYNFTIIFTNDASQEQIANSFYKLNNGAGVSAATMNRVRAKSLNQIIKLGKHKLFNEALSSTALAGHVNDDIVIKSHALLFADDPSFESKWLRPYMRNTSISMEEEKQLSQVFDRLYEIHSLVEDTRVAKRVYTKIHMLSIVPIVWESIKKENDVREVVEWFSTFFSGKRSATISSVYNSAATNGTGKRDSIRKRLEEVAKNYEEFSKSYTNE